MIRVLLLILLMSWLTDLAKNNLKAAKSLGSGLENLFRNNVRAAKGLAKNTARGQKKLAKDFVLMLPGGAKAIDYAIDRKNEVRDVLGLDRWSPDNRSEQEKGEDYADSKERAMRAADDDKAKREREEDREFLDVKKYKRSKPLKVRSVTDDDWARGGVGSGNATWEDFFG